ncbi:phosphatidylserine decarboxylase family protein [Paraburkholderia diazotrophica]|uniref:phosphatidylserine decarboxylase family protein n=1 Tax=Paraburkholderia diazotrophica TaxID=667676 RepID=UPI00317AAFEB
MSGGNKGPLIERRRLGGWMPEKEQIAAAFRQDLAAKARERAARTPLSSVVRDLAQLVHGDAVLRMNVSRAIGEALEAGYELGYRSIDELFPIIDYITTYVPPFSETAPVMTPLNAVLDWLMCMPSGYAVFRDPAFNAQLRRVLTYWCSFLTGPHSRSHLNADEPDGWFCEKAQQKMGLSQFVCLPGTPYWGFTSWNDFFTRRFREGVRPVAEPDNPKAIVSACEASPFNVRTDIKETDEFWIKEQPYSLLDMLTEGERELARRFVGGSIYQGYLSAFNYHRWHAPVAGRVVKAYNVDGTYYSDAESEGEDPGGLNDSQGYTTAVAARAIIVIDADDASIGEVACVFVGMAEVSSCQVTVRPGQSVAKGDELGFFQYGGSTFCLLFRAGVIGTFCPQPPYHDDVPPLHVNAHLATAR